jgi:hypothetical protein
MKRPGVVVASAAVAASLVVACGPPPHVERPRPTAVRSLTWVLPEAWTWRNYTNALPVTVALEAEVRFASSMDPKALSEMAFSVSLDGREVAIVPASPHDMGTRAVHSVHAVYELTERGTYSATLLVDGRSTGDAPARMVIAELPCVGGRRLKAYVLPYPSYDDHRRSIWVARLTTMDAVPPRYVEWRRDGAVIETSIGYPPPTPLFDASVLHAETEDYEVGGADDHAAYQVPIDGIDDAAFEELIRIADDPGVDRSIALQLEGSRPRIFLWPTSGGRIQVGWDHLAHDVRCAQDLLEEEYELPSYGPGHWSLRTVTLGQPAIEITFTVSADRRVADVRQRRGADAPTAQELEALAALGPPPARQFPVNATLPPHPVTSAELRALTRSAHAIGWRLLVNSLSGPPPNWQLNAGAIEADQTLSPEEKHRLIKAERRKLSAEFEREEKRRLALAKKAARRLAPLIEEHGGPWLDGELAPPIEP